MTYTKPSRQEVAATVAGGTSTQAVMALIDRAYAAGLADAKHAALTPEVQAINATADAP